MRITVIFITLLFLKTALPAQEWIVPADRKARLSPSEFTPQNLIEGELIYKNNCMSCHGTPGQNNFLRELNPQPGDPAGEEYQMNSDGELFYKVSEGRGQMPGFKNVLSQNDIWSLISYVRSFNPKYTQVVAPPRRSDAPDYSYISLKVTLGEPGGTVMVQATGFIDNQPLPVADAEVQLSVARTFGKLLIGEPSMTNSEGIATITVDQTLKGNIDGKLLLTARLTQEDLYGISSVDTLVKLGEPVVPTSLREKRAMWNTVQKAPVWLIITFTLAVVAVWGFIIYVLLAVRDIWIAGKIESETKS